MKNKVIFNSIPHSRANSLNFIHQYLEENDVKNKVVIDVSAGVGYVANLFHEAGAIVKPFDLYPELLKYEKLICNKIDLSQKLPIESETADIVLIMETIEHISDQLFLFQELSRILKPNGILILTKPNISHFSGRFANFMTEAERSDMFLPNEKSFIGYDGNRKYNARFFLISAQKIRTLAGLSGLKIEKIYPNQFNFSSLILYLFFGFFFHFRSWLTYKKLLRKTSNQSEKQAILEQFLLNKNPIILFHKHLCISFRKNG